MTDKEISEIRRRFRPDRTNITHIAGCYVSDNREIIARNRRIAADFFARYDHVFLHNPPQAGPIAFHGLRPDFVARFGSALAFCEHLAQSAGVLLLPGNVYDMDAPYVRMGYGRANFAENLAVLDGWLQQNG